MPETKSRKLQDVRIRRQCRETQAETPLVESRASVEISQTVAFAAMPVRVSDDGAVERQVVPVHNATWEFDAKHFDRCPAKGDVIIDASGVEWHVQKTTAVTHRRVRQCQAYAEMTGFLPLDAISIVRAGAEVSPDGLRTTVVWRRVPSNVTAKIATENVASHRKSKAKNADQKLRAYTREYLQLQKNDLVELPDGRQCRIVRVRNSRPMHGWTELFLAVNTRAVECLF